MTPGMREDDDGEEEEGDAGVARSGAGEASSAQGAGGGGCSRVEGAPRKMGDDDDEHDDGRVTTLSLAGRQLSGTFSLGSLGAPRPSGWEALRHLDLSRNRLTELAGAALEALPSTLEVLDVSRNQLRALPCELGTLRHLRELRALSNSLRPPARSLPHDALVSLKDTLTLLDLRFNQKIKPGAEAVEALVRALGPGCEVRLTKEAKGKGELAGMAEAAGERDAALLHSQLAPHSTPQLRARLAGAFGVDTDPEDTGRDEVMRRLLGCYAEAGPRRVVLRRGTPVSAAVCEALLAELRSTQWPVGNARERPKVSACGYFTLQRPSREGDKRHLAEGGTKQRRMAAKLVRHARLWELAEAAMREVDSAFWEAMTAVAFTFGFKGSPHIDTENLGCFYGLSLGDFGPPTAGGEVADEGGGGGGGGYGQTVSGGGGGAADARPSEGAGGRGSTSTRSADKVEKEDGGLFGAIAVESGVHEVTHVDTRGRMAKVEGRNPHWVTPYSGERYSLIYYRTEGKQDPHVKFVT